MDKLTKEWKKSFDEAISSIENAINPQVHDNAHTIKFRKLAKWMLETEHSAYDYMSMGHQSFKNNPYDTDFVLSMLHHALVDDGDIAFVTFKVEGKTQKIFVMFVDKYDDNFDNLCREDNKEAINSLISMRETYINMVNDLKAKGLEANFTSSPSLKASDFTFSAHCDPLIFITEFENFQHEKKEENKKINDQVAKLRTGKM